ncbi:MULTISPECIES: NAD(P)-dependent oxidoreductase [Ramlibacter]|uniref:Hydroxyacid dehydrogenase n=1 Tax=Ramlibacter pinisoli TaxID=2682844 RepID=A0A6N8IPI9_9BURK|nr:MULTISPECIES: NAD(P)-dependent oxidoreductase [Ramlibacter]MBA2963825.1 hydroxyacid dehydrogenase [Ramlibacter sp. CGMCC 1.13660]MVQ28791.1 hydroxyacid dehydrogenase [Ramlibacter pinisoli]
MGAFTVLVTAPALAGEAQQILREAGASIEFMQEPIDEEALLRRFRAGPVDAVVLRGSRPFTARVLEAARGLKVIAKNGAGIDSVDLAAAQRLDVAVAVAAGANADAVAEHALALMLSLVRELPALDRKVRAGGWEGAGWQGRDFRGSVVGIVGYGAIGRATANLAAALGARVVVLRRSGDADAFPCERDLEALLPRVDILSLHCPLTDATRGLIGVRELARMQKGSLLVNTARGAVVDEAALVEALRSGHLAGAGLDTFATEPLPAGSPLRELANVILTPHIAGVTRQSALRVATTTARNVVDVMAGRALPAHNRIAGPVQASIPTRRHP